MDKRDSNEITLVLKKVVEGQSDLDDQLPPHLDDSYPFDALELVTELWPRTRGETVTLAPHQWKKLRRVLNVVPALWLEANK